MMRVKYCLVVTFVLIISLYTSDSENYKRQGNRTGELSEYPLAKFKELKKGMELEDVWKIVGKATSSGGSGISYDVYELIDSTEVWIAYRKSKTAWAFYKKGNKKTVLFE